MTPTVSIDRRAARAWPALRGIDRLPVGAVVVGLAGEVLRVPGDGGVDRVIAGGHPRAGAAGDPSNARRVERQP